MVNVALERSVAVKEQVFLLFKVGCALRKRVKRRNEFLAPLL